MANRIKVMVIDDSSLVRKLLGEYINGQPDMEVIAMAADPYIAVEKLKIERPDVITLDIEMPRMDGLTFLKKLMSQHPIPVIVVSSLSKNGSEVSIKALEYGALDIFLKEDMRIVSHHEEGFQLLMDKIRMAAQSKVSRKVFNPMQGLAVKKELAQISTTDKVVIIGASAGGTEAIREVLAHLPANSPGVVIVQHMPAGFTKSFAESLNKICAMTVKEAENGDTIIPGRVLIAPGSTHHLLIVRKGSSLSVKLWDGPLVNRHRPSVDVLFHSAAEQLGKNAIGIILTGMGADGAKGLLEMKNKGAYTIAQDEATSVVFGMPKEAIKLNAAEAIFPLHRISNEIMAQV